MADEDYFEFAVDAVEKIDADLSVNIDDIELPDDSNFQPSQWMDDRYDVVRGDGITYEGRICNRRKHGEGTLYDENRAQYVTGYWHDDQLIEIHIAQFSQPNETEDLFRIYGWDNLVTCNKHNFVARINRRPLDLICQHFPTIRKDILSKITITKILDDDLKNKLYASREKFENLINLRKNEVTKLRSAQRDIFHIYLVMNEMSEMYNYEKQHENINLLTKISQNQYISGELRNGASDALLAEETVFSRNKKLPIMRLTDFEFSWRKVLSECVKESQISIKKALILSLPTRVYIHTGPEDINNLKTRQLFTCSVHDIQLFKDLELSAQHSTNFKIFTRDYIYKLWTLLIKKIDISIFPDIPNDSVYTHTVFLQLFKTFLELLNVDLRLSEKVEIDKLNFDLKIAETETNWASGEIRLNFVIKLLNHFKPGEIKNYKFNYTFDYFNVKEPQNIIYATVNGIANYVKKKFDNSLTNVPEEYVIWLYYIHFCFSQLNQEDITSIAELNTFLNSLMDLFKTVIREDHVSLEKVRILSNSIIKFGTTIYPYFSSQNSIHGEDLEILLNQADYIKNFVTANEQCLDEITNIVDIYQVFWDERKNLVNDLAKYFVVQSSREKLMESFNSFIKQALDLKIYNNKYLNFLRSFNEFIRLLRGTKFVWYVQGPNLQSKCFVKFVQNNSYLVQDTEKFVEEYKNNNIPKHYLVNTALYFLRCAENFFKNCQWDDKLSAASDLLLLMGRSFISFNKLPNSVDFDKFFSDFTGPFDRVTSNSKDISDFKRRLGSLENYYRYTLELNVMGIEKALELCKKLNTNDSWSIINYYFEYEIVEGCFNVYLDKFNKYVDKHIIKSNFNIKTFVTKVKNKAEDKNFKKWDADFKKTKLPKLLAGLSAVWSALESKDVNSQKKEIIKPHVIQILCILRLLGVDQSQNGFHSHLAQVLTGQGKSIILGLLSAVLALTGNRVRVVCYNKYLATRDQNDFKNFFTLFKIQNDINYGTFENMANEITEPSIKGVDYNLRKFVRDLVTGDLPTLYVKAEDTTFSNTVLLIDEVDVFYTPEFYGNTYNPCTTIGSTDIGNLQIKIWNLTSTISDESDLRINMQKYIDEEYLLSTDPIFISIVKNSRTFLNQMVEEMITTAIWVRNSSPGDWYDRKFKLNKNDNIIVVEDNGEYSSSTYYRYKNVFMYFKLKKTDFEHNSFNNYGYLNVHCGNISYAMLPKDYSAILGVTGTLKQLSKTEIRAVESYGICRGSSMPTFFGDNKLRVTNFSIKGSEDAWSTAILDTILSIVDDGRAVIVFFENEHTIERIKEKFTSHLSRYSVLTGNESDEEIATCVQEAGVAKKVTIATKRMGRGVDFQSNDSTVESKGGVHIIQTFFADDIKQETQIKGRTARMDNSGTYEMIICREHLKEAGYDDSLDSYGELDTARKEKADKSGDELAKNIQQLARKHNCTMDFLKSFYNYKPQNRNEYFQKYPFIQLT